MRSTGPIQEYLALMSRDLPRGLRSRRVLSEIAEHLQDHAARLEIAGLSREAAERRAIDEFGDPADILNEFSKQSPIESELIMFIRPFQSSLIVLTASYAGMHLVLTLLNGALQPFDWLKILVATCVIFYCGALWSSTKQPRFDQDWYSWLLFAGALGMIALGTANMVWAMYLGLVTGDWEYYGILGGGMIATLGGLGAFWIAMQWTRTSERQTI